MKKIAILMLISVTCLMSIGCGKEVVYVTQEEYEKTIPESNYIVTLYLHDGGIKTYECSRIWTLKGGQLQMELTNGCLEYISGTYDVIEK